MAPSRRCKNDLTLTKTSKELFQLWLLLYLLLSSAILVNAQPSSRRRSEKIAHEFCEIDAIEVDSSLDHSKISQNNITDSSFENSSNTINFGEKLDSELLLDVVSQEKINKILQTEYNTLISHLVELKLLANEVQEFSSTPRRLNTA